MQTQIELVNIIRQEPFKKSSGFRKILDGPCHKQDTFTLLNSDLFLRSIVFVFLAVQIILGSISDLRVNWSHAKLFMTLNVDSFFIYIYIYAFSRRFYPKRLTVHSGYTHFCQYVFPGNRTHNLFNA